MNATEASSDGSDIQLKARWDHLLTRERLARERQEVLSEAGKILSSTLDYELTLQHVLQLTIPLLGDVGMLDVVHGDGEVQRLVLAPGDSERQALLERSQDPQPMLLTSLTASPEALVWERHTDVPLPRWGLNPVETAFIDSLGVTTLMVQPLRYHQRFLGALVLFFLNDSERKHEHVDLTVGAELAQRSAAAIENARLFRQVQEASRKRDEFLSVASHELKTPLTTLELQVSALLRSLRLGRTDVQTPEGVIQRLDRVERQVQRLNRIIEELLDATEVGGERIRLRRGPFDLEALVEGAVQRVSPELTQAGSKVVCELSPIRYIGDRSRLDQVVSQLLENAAKFGAGKPIEVLLARSSTGIRLQVVDHGIGIAPEDHERIFERFERAVSPRKYHGLGMGLWKAKQIVEAHGGHIGVLSVLGVGSVFTVDLPG